MYTCDDCREQMWDDLFGLLEPGESANLHRHLMTCSACRAEMETARADHRLVAAAARLEVEVPLLTIPSREAEPDFDIPRPQPVLPHRHRVLPWLAAAAVLLMIGLPTGFYQYGRLRYQAAWHAAENSLAGIVKQREQLHSQANAEREDLIRAALARHLHLQAIGPAAYQAGAATSYHVWVSDVEGRPVDAPITAHLLNGGKPVLLDTKRTREKGQWLVGLPANLLHSSESTPCLEMLAQGQQNAIPVRAYLRVREPAYRTQLAIDRPTYPTGDTIHFRSLTLERFGLKVPERSFTAIYMLVDPQGKELQTLRGLTRKDGIGGGEFSLSANWPAGEYTLTVAEAENRFPPVACRFQVGPVTKDPGKAPQAEHLEVEFFPEGGDLVAEVDNRVYFRVRSSTGQPANLQGAIVDSQGREIATMRTAGRWGQAAARAGLGMFTLRPRPGETYRLQVTSPGALAVHAPFPVIRATGISLSLPNAVGGPKEPLRALLQQAGPERNLIVGLFCRGWLVGQELVTVKAGITEVCLTPTTPCSGVFRITVFEERQGQLCPLAERLAYRRADKRLQVSVRAEKETYAPGDTVRLNIRTMNEQGKPEPAWVLVSVVNQAALSGDTRKVDSSLPVYFQFMGELPNADELEAADPLLSNFPEAANALDLLLGTQSRKGFQKGPADTALVMAQTSTARQAQDLAVPGIVKLDNGADVERRFATSLSQTFADWQERLARRDHELAGEAGERLQRARIAAQDLDDYEERAAGLLRLALGLGSVGMFAAGSLLPGTALWRLVRGWGANRGYLAGAFAALSLCALILWATARGWGNTDRSYKLARIAGFAAELEKRFHGPAFAMPDKQNPAASLAFSKERAPVPRADSAVKDVATARSNTENLQQSQKVPSLPTNRLPWIGSIRATPPTPLDKGGKEGTPLGKGRMGGPQTASTPPQTASVPVLPVQVYAYDPSHRSAWSRAPPNTILWQPVLLTRNGTADVSFKLPAEAATYRILAQGHDAGGRLGSVQEKLECRP